MGKGYGIWLYRNGVRLHGDGRRRHRKRRCSEWRPEYVHGAVRCRGTIGRWSKASAARLKFITANADAMFATFLTLTYRARAETWESDAERNRRVIRRSFADRHRFLRSVRGEIGEYLWVREFQERGVVHYHVLCERSISQERASEAWRRASGQLGDEDVKRYGVKARPVRSQAGVLSYLSRYLGKEKQKELPSGVDGAGRWWGRSRSLCLATLDEVIWLDRSFPVVRRPELQVVRILRRYISKVFRGRYRGGAFVDYGGRLCARLHAMVEVLRAYYGSSPDVEARLMESWAVVEEVERGRVARKEPWWIRVGRNVRFGAIRKGGGEGPGAGGAAGEAACGA